MGRGSHDAKRAPTSAFLDRARRSRGILLSVSFDANSGDAADHAAHLAKLQSRIIDARADINEDDLRRQFDMMMTERAAIERTGNNPPEDATMIAFYDNALPVAYATMRQHARRAAHSTLLAHHMDMMAQVRAEAHARAPAPNPFSASSRNAGGGLGGGAGGGGNGGGERRQTCLRCGQEGHTRRNCKKRKARCKHCSADHLSDFCSRGNSSCRVALDQILRDMIDRDTANADRSRTATGPPAPATYAAAAAAPPPPGSQQPLPPSLPGTSAQHAAMPAAPPPLPPFAQHTSRTISLIIWDMLIVRSS